MLCPICGKPVSEGVRFCPHCGAETADAGNHPRTASSFGLSRVLFAAAISIAVALVLAARAALSSLATAVSTFSTYEALPAVLGSLTLYVLALMLVLLMAWMLCQLLDGAVHDRPRTRRNKLLLIVNAVLFVTLCAVVGTSGSDLWGLGQASSAMLQALGEVFGVVGSWVRAMIVPGIAAVTLSMVAIAISVKEGRRASQA